MTVHPRTRLRRAVVVAGLVLLAGLRLAPALPPAVLLPVSLVWLLALAFLVWAAYRVLDAWIGHRRAIGLLVVAGALMVAPSAWRAPANLAVHLPCPRNWIVPVTWMLRSSPMGSVTVRVDQVPVKICYGRPAARSRTMLGGPQVPFGRLWRTGANEPTTILSPIPLTVAGIPAPAGRAALYTIPGPETWEVILNASTSQWGIESEYDDRVKSREIGRAIVPSEPMAEFVERLRIVPDSGGVALEWEHTRVRIRIGRSGRLP